MPSFDKINLIISNCIPSYPLILEIIRRHILIILGIPFLSLVIVLVFLLNTPKKWHGEAIVKNGRIAQIELPLGNVEIEPIGQTIVRINSPQTKVKITNAILSDNLLKSEYSISPSFELSAEPIGATGLYKIIVQATSLKIVQTVLPLAFSETQNSHIERINKVRDHYLVLRESALSLLKNSHNKNSSDIYLDNFKKIQVIDEKLSPLSMFPMSLVNGYWYSEKAFRKNFEIQLLLTFFISLFFTVSFVLLVEILKFQYKEIDSILKKN